MDGFLHFSAAVAAAETHRGRGQVGWRDEVKVVPLLLALWSVALDEVVASQTSGQQMLSQRERGELGEREKREKN